MPAAKRKPVPEPAAEPAVPIPDARLALHDAIEARKKYDAAVEQHLGAIAKARRLLWDGDPEDRTVKTKHDPAADFADEDEWSLDAPADDRIAELRRRVGSASEGDVRRAVTALKSEDRIIEAFMGKSAERELRAAERKQKLTRAVLQRLEEELPGLQLQAAVAANDVLIEVNKLLEPVAAAALKRLRELRSATANAQGVLVALLRDNPPDFPADDRAFIAKLNSQKMRMSVLGSIRTETERFRMSPPGGPIEEQRQTAEFAAEIAQRVAALCRDPLAPFPTLKD